MTTELIIAPEHMQSLNESESLVARASSMQAIATQEQNEEASVIETMLRNRATEVENMRKIAKEPYLELGRRIDAFFSPMVDKLKNTQKSVKALMIAYHEEQQRRAAEVQAKLDEAARVEEQRLQKLAIQEAKEKGETTVVMPTVERVKVEVAKTVKTDFSSTTFREVWDFEVEDITKLPVKYLQANTAAIGADVRGKDGVRSIPGVRIFSKKI